MKKQLLIVWLLTLISWSIKGQNNLDDYRLKNNNEILLKKSQRNMLPLLDSVHSWEFNGSQWQYLTKNVNYHYDSNGELLDYEYQRWQTQNLWQKHILYCFTYDSLNSKGFVTNKKWNNSSFQNFIRQEFDYSLFNQ
jgi:hypothetical protein